MSGTGKKREDFPERIDAIKYGFAVGEHLACELLYEVGNQWSVDPMVFVERKQAEATDSGFHGRYSCRLAYMAEIMIFRADKFDGERWEDKDETLDGSLYLIPVIEMTLADAEKWFQKFKVQPSPANKCLELSKKIRLGILSMTRCHNGDKTGFETYERGKFAGYLLDDSKLKEVRIPVEKSPVVDLLYAMRNVPRAICGI